ncbi:DUF3899 domain-containing protein [Geobacillus sp. NFOSA3]|jgi:ABC-type multidrug transport system fused ATPase/permease subunit|uniref:DUF3899 domain-containing protein n=2 Tax=Parageobacillus TaxID=1906945 RepID=A0A150MG12_9BACL|nr:MULTISPECIES: DUF3899 domain-containing protein [Bacillaceae]NNU93605.1 DUF3899 domain-containing protein [Geobacillus sp. NFOSA3]KYD23249.1 hypothetical protein B4110_0927 [Parageobacillus toebii]MED4971210.1 DUF3899 domain-containing protein [Parageobacillus toebii]MED4989968.1 DUF3899 domain-containing protein [Parageobacillus toebii]OXB94172.1 hypothetical protein B9L23_04550 [Parageobacillus galactosidasius]
MKAIARSTCLLTAAMLIISFFIVLFRGEWTFLSFVNVTFLLSLLPLVIGGFLFVYEQGFFNGFAYGFRKLRKGSSKAKRYLAELQGISAEQPVHPQKFAITYPFLFSGLILFLLMIAAGYAIR